jgi:urease accessory protein
MGEFPARIVAEDFVTPPELSAWSLSREGTGRIGGARLKFGVVNGVSRLTSVYDQIPVRALQLHLGPNEPAFVYLLNPTAGLLDGDAHRIDLHAGPNTHAVVAGQSATRIHPSVKSFSTQQWNVTVADGAVLVVLPGPAIPFAGSRFFQRVHIKLAENARIIWGDLWFAGRYARQKASERFQFDSLIQDMQVHRNGQLVYRDRFHWHGPWNGSDADWHFGGQPAVGTVYFSGPPPRLPMPAKTNVATGIFTTAAGDTCFRFTGSSESIIRQVVATSLKAASACINQAERPLLQYLGRTHWFDLF